MTYIGSLAMAGMKAMSDDKRVEQERIQGFCPEGVEDFAGVEWKANEQPMTLEEFAKRFFGAEPTLFQPPAMADAVAKLEAHLAKSDAQRAAACADAFGHFANRMNTTLLSGMPAPSPEAQRIAALEAELAAARAALAAAADQALALVGRKPEPAQHPLKRAVAAWPGYGGIDQLTGKPRWV